MRADAPATYRARYAQNKVRCCRRSCRIQCRDPAISWWPQLGKSQRSAGWSPVIPTPLTALRRSPMAWPRPARCGSISTVPWASSCARWWTKSKPLYQVHWDGRDLHGAELSTGVYLARLHYPGGVQIQRLLYLK